ncbi:MAG: DoxX family membrane protein [Deltaproteobacteria bacterium]|nr:DoxX family membrane protein [Deltaproteobacteria bacterium]
MTSLTQWKGHAWIALVVRLYLGGVFLAACFHKIAHPGSFAIDVATYQLLPLALVNAVAILLPWTELIAGASLIAGVRVKAASLLVAAMMISFILALVWALHLHLEMSCGCFASKGAAEDPISWRTLLRDGAWLLMSLYVLAVDDRPIGLERLMGKRRDAHA